MFNCLFFASLHMMILTFSREVGVQSACDFFLLLYISFSKNGFSSSSSMSESLGFVSSKFESFVFVPPGNFTTGKVLIACVLWGLWYSF